MVKYCHILLLLIAVLWSVNVFGTDTDDDDDFLDYDYRVFDEEMKLVPYHPEANDRKLKDPTIPLPANTYPTLNVPTDGRFGFEKTPSSTSRLPVLNVNEEVMPTVTFFPTTGRPVAGHDVDLNGKSVKELGKINEKIDNLTVALQKLRTLTENNNVPFVSKNVTEIQPEPFENITTLTVHNVSLTSTETLTERSFDDEVTKLANRFLSKLKDETVLIVGVVIVTLIAIFFVICSLYCLWRKISCKRQRTYDFNAIPLVSMRKKCASESDLPSVRNRERSWSVSEPKRYRSSVTLVPHTPQPSKRVPDSSIIKPKVPMRYSSLPQYRDVNWLQVTDNDLMNARLHPIADRPLPSIPPKPKRQTKSVSTLMETNI